MNEQGLVLGSMLIWNQDWKAGCNLPIEVLSNDPETPALELHLFEVPDLF